MNRELEKDIKHLEHLLEKYGKDGVLKAVDYTTFGDPPGGATCPKGQIWNPFLGKCVDGIG